MEETVRMRPWRPRFFAVFVAALNNLPANGTMRVLELGSGPGHLAAAMLKRCRITEYVALDFSDAMHDLAKEHLGELASRVRFERRDFREPDWASGLSPVDAVLTLQAVHETRHRDRAPALFRQIRESLKPGGLFLYCDHYLKLVTNPALYLEREEQPGLCWLQDLRISSASTTKAEWRSIAQRRECYFAGSRAGALRFGFDLGGFLLAQLDDVIDQCFVFELINRLAVEIDHAGAGAAAGEANVGFARLTRSVHDAADNRQRHRGRNVLQPLFQDFDRLDDVETLPCAGWTGNDIDAAVT
jgi:SAM-dependent methyltransferase